jgi:hypothetical protein
VRAGRATEIQRLCTALLSHQWRIWLIEAPAGFCLATLFTSQVKRGRSMMRATTLWTLAAIAMLGLSACDKSESPRKVQEDVAKATDSAAEKDAQAADRLAKADSAANKDVANAQAKADEKTTDAAGDAVIAQAEGDHKVALAQCEALSGQAQKDCKKQADDQLDAVKARVKKLKEDAKG